jgi:hypothetical protein
MVRRASPRTMYGFSDGVHHLNWPLRLDNAVELAHQVGRLCADLAAG